MAPINASINLTLYRLLGGRTSLKTRILVAAITMVMAVGVFCMHSLRAQTQLADITHQILDVRINAMVAAQQVKQSFVAYDDALFRYLAIQDRDRLGESKLLKAAARSEIERLLSFSQSPTIRSRIDILKKESALYFRDAERLVEFAGKNRLPQDAGLFAAAAWARSQGTQRLELALLSEEGMTRLTRLFARCDELVVMNRVELEDAQHEMDAILRAGRRTVIVGACLAAGLVALIALGLSVSLLGPIQTLLQGVRGVEKGFLGFEIHTAGNDEIGELLKAFNHMSRTVQDQQERLLQETITDGLTGAFNQRHFREILKQEFERASRGKRALSLLIIDIDHFKQYNDTMGHEFGDEILRRVSKAIKQSLREIDIFARYGGDEFAAILPETDVKAGRAIGERVLEAVLAASFPGQEKLPAGKLTLSIGGATYPINANSADDLFAKADAALYDAKKADRACLRWAGAVKAAV